MLMAGDHHYNRTCEFKAICRKAVLPVWGSKSGLLHMGCRRGRPIVPREGGSVVSHHELGHGVLCLNPTT